MSAKTRSDHVAAPSRAQRSSRAAPQLSPAAMSTLYAAETASNEFEREAEQIAAEVVRRPGGRVSWGGRPAGDEGDGSGAAPGHYASTYSYASSVRLPARSAMPGAERVGPAASIESGLRASSQPLDGETRRSMEQRFGRDFSDVRVHTDSTAAQSAAAAQARAFTVGRDVVFGEGQYAPHSGAGQRLLAHELTHVLQQRTLDVASQLAVPIRQRGTAGIVARAPAPAPPPTTNEAIAPASEQGDTRNYDLLADIIFKAIDRIGTDEEAVYGALQELNREPAAIDKLKTIYKARHPGHDLVADIRDDFSGGELEFALQLINLGDPNSAQHIEATADTTEAGLARAAKRLYDAFEVFLGTDEEAIFAVLLPFKRDQAALGSLRGVYQRNFHESLKERLFDELSGSELEYALFLFLTPQEAYEYFLLQASKDLSSGVPGGRTIGDQTYAGEGAKYDSSRWEPGGPKNPQGISEVGALKVKPGVKPSEAVQEMYNSLSKNAALAYLFPTWRADCAEWVQVHHLYAMLKTLGPYRFDQRFGAQDLWLKPQRATGLKARALFFREYAGERMKTAKLQEGQPMVIGHSSQVIADSEKPEADAEELLKQAPIGSRVAWFNRAIRHPEESGIIVDKEMAGFKAENTIKLGPDLYGAHGFGPKVNMTRRQVEERLLGVAANPKLTDAENQRQTVYIGEIEFYSTIAEEPWK